MLYLIFDLKFPGRRRVGKGGVALLWHKRLDCLITPLSFEDDRIIGLQLEISPAFYIYIFQVYLPCSNPPIAKFREYIDKLGNLLGLYAEKGLVLIMGDFNTNMLTKQSMHVQNNRTRIGKHRQTTENYMKKNNLK